MYKNNKVMITNYHAVNVVSTQKWQLLFVRPKKCHKAETHHSTGRHIWEQNNSSFWSFGSFIVLKQTSMLSTF